ncbi:long-chain fatty acid--CoA ligase [Mycobacterium sp. 852002-51961_SCH5331710]|uniref:AMP-dependent synthetase/ligase n=1 Tax=Mycobacterium sp. 852002-51961_SCH5331710 TaxID=1834105 RepID=UPI0007FEFF1D|nr:long-chain fatty acid--CoA ligase [Mycobacterium sp. 852002-51961_SCH5331710]OBB34780.1 AMP-dependent synthetase [Mycobacterium sp. 852002-51961_SCH5331710]
MSTETKHEPETMAHASVAAMFFDRVRKSAEREAFRKLDGDRWISISWKDAAEQVEAVAAGLLALGIQPEERIGIASSTRYEWILADLAIMCAGAATTTVYPTTNAADTAFILSDSESRIVFAEDEAQLEKLREKRDDLPKLEKVVVLDGDGDGELIMSLAELAELGETYLSDHPSCVESTADAITPDQLATLIYTSGTTGKPKGVRLSHAAWVYEGTTVAGFDILHEDDLQLLWLPLAHAFGKVLISAQLACGFASAIDGRVDKIVANLAEVKPTFMGAAPRIFEKAHARVVTSQEGLKEKLSTAAFAVGRQVDQYRLAGKSVPLPLKAAHSVFDRLVFSKVRAVFGGRIKFFISGSAPLNRDIAEWFHAAGLLILEGYGLTETAAGAFINRPDNYKLGTVGQVFDGTSVRIADDGEVQVKGPCVMDGYHNLPDKTAESMTEDGWLRTGDRGQLDDDGFLTITGRIKELFKTSGGKYVAPPAIEGRFMALCPYASHILVFGESRKFCVALITLDPDELSSWAKQHGLGDRSYEDLVQSDEVRDMIDGYVDELNSQLNRWETIKKWELLDHELSVEGGELTPSLKVKRSVVEEKNQELLDSFYS